jgi:hypothetical protein
VSGLSEQQLAEIAARAEAATPGPWCTDAWEIYQGAEYVAGAKWIGETCRANDAEGACADSEFIAHARTDVPALLAEVGRLGAQVADLEAERAKLIRWHEEDARQLKTWGRRVAKTQQQVRDAHVAGLMEAAGIVGNDDTCDCGGCDTCVPRQLAADLRERAALRAGGAL